MVTYSSIGFYSSSALETTSQISAHSCHLVGMLGTNNNSAAVFVQVFDKASAPSNQAVPLISWPVAAGGVISLDLECINSMVFTNGCVVALSSTVATYTAVSTQLFLSAWYL